MIPVITSDGIEFTEGSTLGYCPNYLQGSPSAEIFIVLRAVADPNPGSNNLWEMGKSDTSTAYPDGAGMITDDWGSTTSHDVGNPAQTLTEYALYNVRSTPSEWTAYLDNVKLFTTPTNTVGFPDEMRIGGGVIVREIAIYSPALSETDRLRVANTIGYRNGLDWATAPTGVTDPDAPPDSSKGGGGVIVPPPPITAGANIFGIALFREDMSHFGEAPFNTHAVTVVSPSELAALLQTAQTSGRRIVANLTPQDSIMVGGVFSFNAYKTCAEQYRSLDVFPYIADGTLAGIYVIDEPNHLTRWGLPHGIPLETVDQMCAVWKGIYPLAKTFVRARPSLLVGHVWKFLNSAWCNYVVRHGDVNLYIQTEKRTAQELGLTIMWGVNCINGGTDDPNDPLFFNHTGDQSDWYNMGPAALLAYGTALCSETYSEGFIPWKYDEVYMGLAGIRDTFIKLAGGGTSTTPTPTPTPTPTRTVNVATTAQLSTALAGARPGDAIVLAPGTYTGRFTITTSGTSTAPITLSGPRTAILSWGDYTGNMIYLNGASYWRLQGFTITGAIGGVAIKNGASHNIVDGLLMHKHGMAGVRIMTNSSNNILRNNEIYDCGMTIPQYGEGIYIGTSEHQWINGVPDHSDNNEASNNYIHDVKADGIQYLAGTTGTIVRGNTIDGAAMVVGNVDGSPPHWILVMGNNGLVENNILTNSLTHGIKIRRSTTANTWASNNVLQGNQMTMNTGGLYNAIYLETAPAQGNIVRCAPSNVRTDAGTMTNMTCTSPPIDPSCLNTVNVATTAELNTALANASPGDCIVMAAGTYTGTRVVTVSGTASNPIKLSGPTTAIIGGTGLAASAINLDLRGNYWILDGFTMTNAYQPLFIQGGHDNIVRNLRIYNIGQEALHIKASAHHNTVDGCNIHDTGKTNPSFGEGIYIGSGGTGAVDHADFNTIQNCIIGPNIAAQMVDLKEGTTGNIVQNNTFDGAGSSTNQDAWVNVYGNQSQILNNVGSKARVYGYKNEVLVAGWGESNEFKGNTLTLNGGAWGSATGPGFRVGGGAAATVVLWCPPSNTVTGGTGFSNISCNAN